MSVPSHAMTIVHRELALAIKLLSWEEQLEASALSPHLGKRDILDNAVSGMTGGDKASSNNVDHEKSVGNSWIADD